MSITKDQIIEAVASMSVMEVVELIEAMEEKFGVSAAVAVAAGPAAEAVEEKTEFDVVLTAAGANKVAVIKVSSKPMPTYCRRSSQTPVTGFPVTASQR